jgi:hypothetical protein
MADRAKIVWADFHSRLWHSSELNRTDRFGALFSRHKKLSSRLEAIYLQPCSNLAWCNSCNTPRWWRVSNDESRRVVSEGEGACSPFFRVRSHLPLRGKQGWMTPRVGVKTTLTNGSAPLGALVPKQGPHFLPGRSLRKAVVWADESAGSRRVDPISSCPSRRRSPSRSEGFRGPAHCATAEEEARRASSPFWSPEYSVGAVRV